jgi:hypothetical protein
MTTTATPPGLDQLLQLFRAELASVQFPGVDAKVLDAAVERVALAALEVAECHAALEAARAQLAGAQDDALAKGQRALAYARVFAQDTPALLAKLGEVELSGAASAPSSSTLGTAPAAPRRRGRPPKSASASTLFHGSTDEQQSLEPPVRIVLEADAT